MESVHHLFKPAVRELPWLHHLIQQGLGTNGLVWLKMPPPNSNSGKSLAWCRERVDRIFKFEGPQVYKIGVTADPMFRFFKKPTVASPSPGYYFSDEKFKCMHVLYCGVTWEEAALMEAVLIESHLSKPGNRNVRPGGEGRQVSAGPFFTYVVFKPAM